MLLNELWVDTDIKKNNNIFDTLNDTWNYIISDSIGISKLINLGKIGKYTVQFIHESKNLSYGAICSSNSKPIAITELKRYGKGKNVYKIINLGVSSKYRGANLAPLLYKFLIMKGGLILCSGTQQSPGGRKVWEKLAQMPGIFVYAYNPLSKNSFQIDIKDIENEYVYDIDYDNEIKYMQKEKDDIENKMVRDSATPEEENKFVKLSNQIDKLITQQDKSNCIRLIAVKK